MMECKGYTGQITAVDEKQGLIHGRVAGITDVITFEGSSFEDLVQAFHDSVDDYLDFCGERKESPEKPLSGKFLLRISSELHKQASRAGRRLDLLGLIQEPVHRGREPGVQPCWDADSQEGHRADQD